MPNYTVDSDSGGDVVIWKFEGSSKGSPEGKSDGTGTPSDDFKFSDVYIREIRDSEGSSEGTSDGTGTPSDDSKLSDDIESKTVGSYDGFLMPKSTHDDDFEDHLFFSKNQPSFEDLMSKANRFTWVAGSNVCTSMTYDEYGAHRKWLDELKPAGWNDPNTYKEHSAEVCHEWFPVIQEQFPEMADYELVETMAGNTFVACGGVAHINFKAKHKNVGDSSLSVYFAEIAMTKRKVTCFTKLHIDPSSGTDGGYQRRCGRCHPKKPFPYAGYVYHPVNEVTWVEGCLSE